MNKFEKIKNESDEAYDKIQEAIMEDGDDDVANEAADLLISVLLKALWSLRTSSEFNKLEEWERDLIFEMIKEYETVLSYTDEGEDA